MIKIVSDPRCRAQALKSVGPEEKEAAERRVKQRTLGNIRLIAELYKKGVVTERILHFAIDDLMGDTKADPAEAKVEVPFFYTPSSARLYTLYKLLLMLRGC